MLAFIRALRISDFELYTESLAKLAPWFFAMDHVHYAGWVPVHVRDMTTLHQRCPDVYEQFMCGAFTSNKTGHSFSAIGLDQAHEHLNARMKGDGGAIGLTENPGALRRWMVAGPQLSAIIAEFEEQFDPNDGNDADDKHHEQTHSSQKSFFEDVCGLVSTLKELGNPFLDRSKDLLTLHTQEIMPMTVVETIQQIHATAEKQYSTFIEDRLLKNETPVSAPISRNTFPLFSRPNKAAQSKDKQTISELKSDCSLFARLYIGSQSREGNLEEFFKHKNQKFPPSLSTAGKLRQGKKSDLLGCLESCGKSAHLNTPTVEVRILDGAAVVHFLPVGESRSFGEYAREVFIPYVVSELERSPSRYCLGCLSEKHFEAHSKRK